MERRQRRDGVARPRILAHSARESELPGWRGRWSHGTVLALSRWPCTITLVVWWAMDLWLMPLVLVSNLGTLPIEPALYVGLMLARNSTIRVSDSDWFDRLMSSPQSHRIARGMAIRWPDWGAAGAITTSAKKKKKKVNSIHVQTYILACTMVLRIWLGGQ